MADRDFKGVWIPRQVWLDDNLTMLDKGILTEIDSLDMGEDGCWASNEYLAKFCGCSECKVSLTISKLARMGYIKVESFDGRRRKIKSCLLLYKGEPFKKSKADLKKVKESNIPNNPENKPINSNTRSSAKSEIPEIFSRFYSAYPRKVSKPAALRAWKGLKADAALTDRIIADVKRRCDTEWKGQAIQYIPHPSTYLNQRRWEDETAPTERKEAGHRGIDPQENPALNFEQREYKDEDFGDDFFIDLDKYGEG